MISLPKLRFYHICVVVKDLEKAVEYYTSKLGLGPFEFGDVTTKRESIVRGEKRMLSFRGAHTEISPGIGFELWEGTEGSVWAEFLEAHGEGLHHLGFAVDDLEAEIAKWEKQGIKVLQRSVLPNYAYMDAAPVIELFQKRQPPRPY